MSGNALAIDAQVKHEQAYALYRQGPAASIITAIVGGGGVVAMWNHASHTILLIWYGLSLTNQIVRVALTATFQKSRPQIGKTDIWVRRYQWGMMVGGILFGSMPIIMFPENDPLGQG